MDIPEAYKISYLDPNKPVVFIDVAGREKYDKTYSKFNTVEVDKINEIIQDLTDMNIKPGNVGIITTYKSQREKLKEKIGKRYLEISTVDSYQGREKDIIIYSVVGTRDFSFIEDENRLNVAFTRAKKKLIVVGNVKSIMDNSPNGLLSKYIRYAGSLDGFFSERKQGTNEETLKQIALKPQIRY